MPVSPLRRRFTCRVTAAHTNPRPPPLPPCSSVAAGRKSEMDGMDAAAGHDHAGHNHSAHDESPHEGGMGGMDMDKYMGGVERLPDGGYHYPHGAFTGHVVPGTFFLVRPPAGPQRDPAPSPPATPALPEPAYEGTPAFQMNEQEGQEAPPGCPPQLRRKTGCCPAWGSWPGPCPHSTVHATCTPAGPPPPPTHPPTPLPQVWGLWWTVTTFAAYVQCLAARRGFCARAWRPLPWGPPRLRRLPLEPIVKIVLPAFGILGELWLGHESWRRDWGSREAAAWAGGLGQLLAATGARHAGLACVGPSRCRHPNPPHRRHQ